MGERWLPDFVSVEPQVYQRVYRLIYIQLNVVNHVSIQVKLLKVGRNVLDSGNEVER